MQTSVISGIISAIFIYNQNYKSGAVLYLIAYIFDCADGNYARKYNMVTSFGDKYDHYSDIFKFILTLIVILVQPICRLYKIIIMFSAIILYSLTAVHFGCQEKIYNKPYGNEFLSNLVKLCPSYDAIYVTRYMGCGTIMVYITVLILLIPFIVVKQSS